MRMIAVPLVCAGLTLSGCAAFSSSSAEGDGVQVAAGFYPLAYAAERVAGDHADVELLTIPGKEPHDLELTVQQTAVITSADLVIYENDFQPAVDAAVADNADGATLDAADVVDPIPFDESMEEHEGHDEHSEEEGHEHGELDPHFWHDPLRMAELADAVADRLSDLDPENAEDYRANADALRADLEDLDASYDSGLAQCERDTIVVSHDAFGYLEKYGLHLAPIAGLSPDAEPTPADLGSLQELIRKEGITTVFSERLVSPELAETLANDLGIKTAVLDPVEGLTEETADQDYLSLMRQNLAALREANGC